MCVHQPPFHVCLCFNFLWKTPCRVTRPKQRSDIFVCLSCWVTLYPAPYPLLEIPPPPRPTLCSPPRSNSEGFLNIQQNPDTATQSHTQQHAATQSQTWPCMPAQSHANPHVTVEPHVTRFFFSSAASTCQIHMQPLFCSPAVCPALPLHPNCIISLSVSNKKGCTPSRGTAAEVIRWHC